MTIFVYIAVSIDGYIATSDGGIEWLMEIPNPDHVDFGFTEFMKGIDAIVMGRNTFEKVLSFGKWPYTKPVFVLTTTLTSVPVGMENKAEIVKGDIEQIVNNLNERGFQNLYVDGGKVVQSFLEKDLIDEMIITRVSVLLGRGVPLFGNMDQSLKFRQVKTTAYNDDLVKSYYKRVRVTKS
jgi:dihydrofolate reductase